MSEAGQRAPLAERAYRIRRNALLMGEVQGQGYIGQALDIADVLAVAYFGAMRYQPENPEWEGRDRFLLSNGHYAIALYAALFEAGFLPPEELETYGSDDSRLPMSGMASYTPGMEMSGGSLGHGLTIAVGRCLGLKRKGSDAFVYTLFSDGELDEGAIWEGLMSAAHWKLDNLIAIVDVNNQQADGPSSQVMAFEPLVEKLASVRLVRATHRRQRYRCSDSGLRQRAQSSGSQAAHHRLRYAHGLRRAVPRRAREEPLYPRRSARVATRACRARSRETTHERHRHRKKPRLKTSAMIASIAGEGQITRSAPFGHALVELARERQKWSA